jgi:thiol-disulfide isomerase/thioredoxin
MGSLDAFGMSSVGLNDLNAVHLRPLDQDGNQKAQGHLLSGGDTLGHWTHSDFQIKAEKTGHDIMTSGEFVRNNFSEVISGVISLHEFTLVYFHADWCEHSRAFDPDWSQLVEEVSEKMQFPTASGQAEKVTLRKLNCAVFSDTCRELGIKSFPTLRMYNRNGAFATHKEGRSADSIKGFIQNFVDNRVQVQDVEWGGCAASGTVNVPRVQGNFHLTVGYGPTDTPNPDLVNMSIIVNHLSFNDPTANFWTGHRIHSLVAEGVPSSVTDHIMPIDGKEFIVERADAVPEHFLKVVRTKIGAKKEFYQVTHSAKTGSATDTNMGRSVPVARFSYDFSPFSVVLQRQSKPWYDLLTSFIAIVGGSFAIVQMCGGTADKIALSQKASGKRS